ncbi:MAG: Asp23/Gls24 family envelope stress response protein [Clostridia bacterium]|nr:Asp23/Gls24 family envelope stress response protein [Clostridia bacterium]
MAIKTENEHGAIVVSENVIARIAGVATSTCYGVVGMAYKSTSDNIAALLKWDSITKGITVNTEDEKISIDLHIIVEYGVNVKVICESIIENVKYAVESATGFKVGKVTVNVESVRID